MRLPWRPYIGYVSVNVNHIQGGPKMAQFLYALT